jgi:hypothetical protein
MPWPLSQDYNEAIQNPAQCFADPELQQGEAETNALGLPAPRSGNFADVYAVVTGARKWAVKCFTRQIPGLQERYRQISLHLEQAMLPFLVGFTFQEKGIRVRGDWYPILKMQWVEGVTLNQFVKSSLDKPKTLDLLCKLWVKLAARLREGYIAHCDLQHGNVLLVPGDKAATLAVKLVDYDGLCVPSLSLFKSNEVGHPAYQHPQRQRDGVYNLEVDRFSHLVIYTALRALLIEGQDLWEQHDDGDNLLFRPGDLAAPDTSALLERLQKSSSRELRTLHDVIVKALSRPLDQAPLLDSLVTLSAASGGPASGKMPKPAPAPMDALEPTVLDDPSPEEEATSVEVISPRKRRRRRRRRKKNTSRLPIYLGGGAFLVALVGLIVVLQIRSRTASALPEAKTNPPPETNTRAGELPPPSRVEKPETAPRPPSTPAPVLANTLNLNSPRSFYFDYNGQPDPGKRIWRRIDEQTWTERYPSGKEDIFKIVRRDVVDDISGVVLQKLSENIFEVFIPDLGSKRMYIRFRRTRPNPTWGSLGPMRDVQ